MRLEVTAGGRVHEVEADLTGEGQGTHAPTGIVIHTPTGRVEVRLESVAGAECWRLEAEGRSVPVRLRHQGEELLVTVGAERFVVTVRRALPIPSRRRAAVYAALRREVRAPMPGLVVAVQAGPGDTMQAGGVVAIIEAMKMQMEVPAPADGLIEEIRVQPGQEVAGGQVLAVMRAAPDAQAPSGGTGP